MQKEIIELQERAVQSIYKLANKDYKTITLKAPTGSGKTHIMANFINKMITNNDNIVFIVSVLSKGRLATQIYDSFNALSLNVYTKLKPYYVSSGGENSKNTEYSLYIDDSCNVYVLPTSQYTDNSRIHKERSFINFLEDSKNKGKKIILIRDESHIATNKLDLLSNYFYQTINFSATPKDDKYDVIITEDDAVKSNLIKQVEYIENDIELKDDLNEALNKFILELQPFYRKKGINPAFIIQISNKLKAEEEIEIIKVILEERNLQWVYFAELDKTSRYATNSKLNNMKNKRLWQNYVKESNSFIDVIIFKMVITEGFDIPRACMLYQVRDSKSKQLDEQVIGRVRRNPCLTYFETLDKKTQEIFCKAYIYGIKPKEIIKRRKKVTLHGIGFAPGNEIVKEFRPFKVTTLKDVPLDDIDITKVIDKKKVKDFGKSVFKMYREFEKSDIKVKEKYNEYVTSSDKWLEFMANLESIQEEVKSVVEDYDTYGSMKEINDFREYIESYFDDNGNLALIDDWIWVTDNDEYGFDSEAEKSFFKILKDIRKKCCKYIMVDNEKIYLFGKNFIDNSNIKYDYYHTKKHTSYPDFIFKDKKNRIHIFEVKSVNKNSLYNLDEEEYKEKIEKLKKAYIYASKMTGYIFYISIQIEDDWQIWKYENGIADDNFMNKDMFIDYMNS